MLEHCTTKEGPMLYKQDIIIFFFTLYNLGVGDITKILFHNTKDFIS